MNIELLGECLACGNFSMCLSTCHVFKCIWGNMQEPRAPGQGTLSFLPLSKHILLGSWDHALVHGSTVLFSTAAPGLAAARIAQTRHPNLISFFSTHAVYYLCSEHLQLSLSLKLFSDAHSLVHRACVFPALIPFTSTVLCWCCSVVNLCPTLWDLRTVVCQAPLCGVSKTQEY